MKTLARIVFLSLLIPLATLSFAQTAPADVPAGPQHFLKRLGLTDDQVTQVTDLFAKQQAAVRTQRAEIRVLKAQIDLGLSASTPDVKAVDALVDQKTKLQADVEKQTIDTEVQIQKIVGDKIFFQLKDAWFHHRRGEGQNGGPRADRNPGPMNR